MVEEDDAGIELQGGGGQLIDLARAEKMAGGRFGAAGAKADHRFEAGGAGQFMQFVQVGAVAGQVKLNQDGPLADLGAVEELKRSDRGDYSLPPSQDSSSSMSRLPAGGSRTGRAGTTVEMACL